MYAVSEAYKQQLKKKRQRTRLIGSIAGKPFTGSDILTDTFQISNQCSEVNEVKIGSVYIGQLKMTLKPHITFSDWEKLEISVSEALWIESDNKWEQVPLGVFRVSEAEVTDYGTDITADDDMSKFEKTCDIDTTTGQPYDLLELACTKCGVILGMTRNEVESLINGTEAFVLYSDNDIETWRDFLFWLAQTLCCFSTINREGKLVLKEYNRSVVDTFDNHKRFSDSRFSNFITRYSGLSVVNIAEQKTEYYGVEPNIYLTYNLGSNPFLQYGSSEGKDRIRRNILNGLSKIEYVPFESKVLTGALYDLGDVIRCKDGIALGGMSCIMSYIYTKAQGYSVAGFGSNPALASAKGKTDKNLAGLMSQIKSNELIFYSFENAKSISIGDGVTDEIIDIRFTAGKSILAIFQAEILLDVSTTVSGIIYDDARALISYIYNESEIEFYHPVETYTDGKHILNLMYIIPVEAGVINHWVVRLKMSGGSADIPAQNIRAAIYGQGLAASDEWNGIIEFTENILDIPFTDMSVDDIEAVVDVVVNNPIDIQYTEKVSEILFGDMVLDEINEFLSAYVTESALLDAEHVPSYDTEAVELIEDTYRVIEDAETPQYLIKKMIDVDNIVYIGDVSIDATNITLQFSTDGEEWQSYINEAWQTTNTEMFVNDVVALSNEDWLKLAHEGVLWIRVNLNVASSSVTSISISFTEGV